MPEKFELQHRGRSYTVERGEPRREAATGGGAPVGTDSWYITLNLAAVTSLPAVPDEHPEPHGGEGIVLGGG
jgi:hypothetical protein